MYTWRNLLKVVFAAVLPLTMAIQAKSQIVVGITTGVTGAVATSVKENLDGARLYVDAVNAVGGLRGERIELIVMDDQFEPAKAADNAREMVTKRNVVALFLTRGTPHTEAILPLLKEFSVPMVAPSTGAMLLHQPVNPHVFNVRAPYQREAQKAITHLASIGINRIAVIHPDDSFGRDALEGAMAGFAEAKSKPSSVSKVDRNKPDYSVLVAKLAADNAQAVVWIGSAGVVAGGIQALRLTGSAIQVVTLSNNASGGFVKLLGNHSRGVVVTQVFPSERSLAVPMVSELKRLATAAGIPNISPATMEGFAGAKVLVEGLRRAGLKPTRERLQAALEGMGRFDLGGVELGYSALDHSGLDFADLSIIGTGGQFLR